MRLGSAQKLLELKSGLPKGARSSAVQLLDTEPHFQKQRQHVLKMPLAKFGNVTKVGDVFADDHAKIHIRFTPLSNVSRRKNANGVRIQQKPQHHAGGRKQLASIRLSFPKLEAHL